MRRTGRAFLAVAALLLTTASASAGAVVLADLNVRAGPGTRFPVIGGLPRGATVQVLSCSPSWCNIGSAFVSAAFLGFDGPAPYVGGPVAAVPVGIPVAVPVAVPVPVPTPIVVTQPNPSFIVAPPAPIFYGPPPRLYINPPVPEPQPNVYGGWLGWGGYGW